MHLLAMFYAISLNASTFEEIRTPSLQSTQTPPTLFLKTANTYLYKNDYFWNETIQFLERYLGKSILTKNFLTRYQKEIFLMINQIEFIKELESFLDKTTSVNGVNLLNAIFDQGISNTLTPYRSLTYLFSNFLEQQMHQPYIVKNEPRLAGRKESIPVDDDRYTSINAWTSFKLNQIFTTLITSNDLIDDFKIIANASIFDMVDAMLMAITANHSILNQDEVDQGIKSTLISQFPNYLFLSNKKMEEFLNSAYAFDTESIMNLYTIFNYLNENPKFNPTIIDKNIVILIKLNREITSLIEKNSPLGIKNLISSHKHTFCTKDFETLLR